MVAASVLLVADQGCSWTPGTAGRTSGRFRQDHERAAGRDRQQRCLLAGQAPSPAGLSIRRWTSMTLRASALAVWRIATPDQQSLYLPLFHELLVTEIATISVSIGGKGRHGAGASSEDTEIVITMCRGRTTRPPRLIGWSAGPLAHRRSSTCSPAAPVYG